MIKSIKSSMLRKALDYTFFLNKQENCAKIKNMADILIHCLNGGNKVLVCGNGGSAADGAHFAAELTGRFRQDRKSYPAIAFTDPAYLTAVANDYGYAEVFGRQVEAFGKPGDVLVCLSTSGMSMSVTKAAMVAQGLNVDVIALTGNAYGGGGLAQEVPPALTIIVDSQDTASIQEIHMSILHTLVEVIEKELK